MANPEQLNKPVSYEDFKKQLDAFIDTKDSKAKLDDLAKNLEKNQRVIDLVLDDIKQNLPKLKELPKEQKQVVADMLLVLMDMDAKNVHINRDSVVYKDLIYQLMGGKEVDDSDLKQNEYVYKTLVSFIDGVSNICSETLSTSQNGGGSDLDAYISQNTYIQVQQKMKPLLDDFVIKTKLISDPSVRKQCDKLADDMSADVDNLFKSTDKSLTWKQKRLKDLVEDANKKVKGSYKEYSKSLQDYDEKISDRNQQYAKIQVGDKNSEQYSSQSRETILVSNSELGKYILEDQYVQSYNEIFDVMYMSGLQPGTFSFRGKEIKVTEDHIILFKRMLDKKLSEDSDFNKNRCSDFSYNLIYNSKQNDVLQSYPEGMRLVKVKYSNGTIPMTKYIVPGKMFEKQQLVAGFKQVLKDPELSQKVHTPEMYCLDDFEKHGGPDALKALFDARPQEMVNTMNLPGFLETFVSESISSVPETRRAYLLTILTGIQSDKQLVSQYFDLFKENLHSLQDDIPTKQLISNKLFEITQGPLFATENLNDKDLVHDVAVLKATIDSQKLSDQPKSLEGQIQSLVKQGVGMLFAHPIGKMLMSFLDSVFGGKGGLKSMFGRISGFNEELDSEFRNQYGLKGEQQDILKELGDIGLDNSHLLENSESILDNNEKTSIAKMFLNNDGIRKIDKDVYNSPYVLNPLFLSSYYISNQKEKEFPVELSYESVFSVDPNTKEVTFNEGNRNFKNNITELLNHMMSNKAIKETIFKAETVLQGNGERGLFNKSVDVGNDKSISINTKLDYARAMAGYLMSGNTENKDDFHYVLSENNIGSKKKEPAKEENQAAKKEENQAAKKEENQAAKKEEVPND